jgi:hypothetical protein
MTSRNSLKKNDDVAVKYGHILQVLTDWIDVTVMALIGGRGLAKSTVIQANRSSRCVYDMPGGAFAFISKSYSNLEENIMPAVQNGWKLLGLIEGIHYIKGIRPPESWRDKCSVIVDDYHHAYSFFNGCVIFLGSLDNPSLLAGKSVLHIFYDEAKFDNPIKVNRAMPILRGDAIQFGHSHLFLGLTITCDMPDITEGEFDWFFRYVSQMNPDRIIKIAQTASVRNELLIKREQARRRMNVSSSTLRRIDRDIEYYDRALLKLRKGQTFFFNASSFVNVDILTPDYIERLYNGTLELHEFMKSVLGMRPGLRRDIRFYLQFGERHKYVNGTASGEAAYSSRELKFLHADRPIDGGMDFGNMLSLVIGQKDGSLYRIHKDIYEIPPRWFRELADQFLDFFKYHNCKEMDLYYDRAGNNFQRQKEDYATKIKEAIEIDVNGIRTGWVVNLKSRKQSIIRMDAEYDFMQELMSGNNKALPTLVIDALNCRELISSIEKAPAEIKYSGQQKSVVKIKKSEKLAPNKLPMNSTNFSDAFKYLMMRSEWRKCVKGSQRPGPEPYVPGF